MAVTSSSAKASSLTRCFISLYKSPRVRRTDRRLHSFPGSGSYSLGRGKKGKLEDTPRSVVSDKPVQLTYSTALRRCPAMAFIFLALFIALALSPLSDASYTPTGSTGYSCPTLFNYYADAYDCTRFYRCFWGEAYAFRCPAGTRWSQAILTCDHAYNVPCGGYGVQFEASYGLSHGAKYDGESYSGYEAPSGYSSGTYLSSYNDGYPSASYGYEAPASGYTNTYGYSNAGYSNAGYSNAGYASSSGYYPSRGYGPFSSVSRFLAGYSGRYAKK